MFLVSIAFSSLAQHQKLWKGVGRKRVKFFGVVSTSSFFLKVSFDACENSSLTVEDIHYWQII